MAELLGKDPAEVVGRFHGMTGSQTPRTIDPTLSPRQVAELNDTLIDLEVADSASVVAVPARLQVLDGLPSDRWAIVTSCPSRLAWARIEAAGVPHPTTLVTAEDVAHSKPHPEPYQLVARQLGRDPGDCLAVEDAPAGVASALAAGCQVLGCAPRTGARSTSTPSSTCPASPSSSSTTTYGSATEPASQDQRSVWGEVRQREGSG